MATDASEAPLFALEMSDDAYIKRTISRNTDIMEENNCIQTATQSQLCTFGAMRDVRVNLVFVYQSLTLLGKREAGCTFVCWKNVVTHEDAS